MVTHLSIPRSVHPNLTPSPGSPKHPTTYLMLRHNWEISIPFSTPRPTNSFPNYRCISKHHYIFRPISFQMHRNPPCWFPRAPFSSPVMLLLVCFCLSLLRESTLLFIFCLSDLCVDGIRRAHLWFFRFL